MKIDLISIAALIVMGFCIVIGLQYYYNMQHKICMKDPLAYGANALSKEYGYPFYGSGYFIAPGKLSPIISFDSHSSKINIGPGGPYNNSGSG